ncbi:ribulose phosphate epimerase [Pseudomonas aeruginosa]|nr:ribulose phosphate epimerase [Pseudomonas aeruginosa]
MSQTFHGSCLCGALRYRLSSPPRALSHCHCSQCRKARHCSQCRKAHGAAFASYGSVPVADLHIDRGADLLAAFSSSPAVLRRFCSRCGSPLFWSRSEGKFADWVSVALGSLDTPFPSEKQKHVQVASMACWYRIADHWPRQD